MGRVWVALGALAGLLAVAMSAWAAHALPATLAPAALQQVRDGIEMQGWHALALLACGVWARAEPRRRLLHAAGAAFAIGVLLFCGGVYALALGGIHPGPLAPTGGILLMLGWLLLGVSALAG
jgi:uncharacterized membrane protein YgdD (TMEM256/DUF423 family)